MSSGLGVAKLTSYQVDELMGGEVGFESELGKGSRFWVSVPLEEAKAEGEMLKAKMK